MEFTRVDASDLFDWADHRDELVEAGYERRAPGNAAEIDGPIARACVCPICNRSMEYWPMLGSTRRDYIAFAVCEPCDKALEF